MERRTGILSRYRAAVLRIASLLHGLTARLFSSTRYAIPMRVYLDDERTPPEGWRLVRWPDEAIALLEQSIVDEISLDHDLGDDERGTGYDVVLWVERAVVERGFVPPIMHVHSANSSARVRMEAGIAAIARLAARRDSGA